MIIIITIILNNYCITSLLIYFILSFNSSLGKLCLYLLRYKHLTLFEEHTPLYQQLNSLSFYLFLLVVIGISQITKKRVYENRRDYMKYFR